MLKIFKEMKVKVSEHNHCKKRTLSLQEHKKIHAVLLAERARAKFAKLHTVAASNDRDHAPQSLSAYASHYVQSFTS